MHRGGRVAVQERVNVVVPHHSSVGRLDDARLERADEPAVGVVEVGGVVERQAAQVLAVRGLDDGGRRLLIHAFDLATIGGYAGFGWRENLDLAVVFAHLELR